MLWKHDTKDVGGPRTWRKPLTDELANELDASGSHKLAAVVREAIAHGPAEVRRTPAPRYTSTSDRPFAHDGERRADSAASSSSP